MKTSSLICTLILLAGNLAFAAGFEKSVMWSGRHAGVGNAAVATVRGSEAIYFNPAGLATGNPDVGDISLNVSPTFSEFQGSYRDNVTSTSETSTTFPFGMTASYTLSEKFGVGIGAYAAAGSEVLFNDVVLIPGFDLMPDFKTSIQSVELAIGAAYNITEDLSVGAAWRMALASGEFWAAGVAAGPTLISYRLEDLQDEEFAGFKLGAIYSPSEKWGVGAMFRSEFNFDMQGVASGQTSTGVGVTDRAGTDATARVVFPMQYSFGGFFEAVTNVKLLVEYAFTEYSKNDIIDINGSLVGVGALSDVTLNWKDQHNLRLGVEYLGLLMPLRAGYVFTSAVAVPEHATPSLTPPGPAHTFTLGTGYGFLKRRLMVNIAGEITTTTGEVPFTDGTPAAGEYSAMAYVAHLGATYNF